MSAVEEAYEVRSVQHAEYLLLLAGHCAVGDCARGDEPDVWYAALALLLAERAPA